MLNRLQVQRYAAESGLRDMMIAEKEVVLTHLLQLLAERGLLNKLAFKGGTCIRKMFIGNQGRFSTDLDFTGLEEHDHNDVVLEMMAAFEEPFHGIQFKIPGDGYYETLDGMSWGVNPGYSHEWNRTAESEIRLQIRRRETPTLKTESRHQYEQSYFKSLPFTPSAIQCLPLPEIISEKVRACYQRNKARDIYDLGVFATKPLNQPLIRRLVVLKLWQARDTFEPERLLRKFHDNKAFDWDDLRQLIRKSRPIDLSKIVADCVRGYSFLEKLTAEEMSLAKDPHQREHALWQMLRDSCAVIAR